MEKTQQGMRDESGMAGWRSFCQLAGAGVLVSVGLILVDMGLTFAGGDVGVGDMNAAQWFAHFQSNWFIGLRNFGLFNVINTTLTIPLYMALYWLHRKASPMFAALALALFLLATGIYGANNRALAMLALSQDYAAASTEAQKTLLEAAGTVTLAQAEDFTPGSFWGLFLSNVASLTMMAVILQGRVLRKWIGVVGLVGMGCLLFFTISATFVPASFNTAMFFAMIGGLCMLAWDIAIAVVMLRMGTAPLNKREHAAVSSPSALS